MRELLHRGIYHEDPVQAERHRSVAHAVIRRRLSEAHTTHHHWHQMYTSHRTLRRRAAEARPDEAQAGQDEPEHPRYESLNASSATGSEDERFPLFAPARPRSQKKKRGVPGLSVPELLDSAVGSSRKRRRQLFLDAIKWDEIDFDDFSLTFLDVRLGHTPIAIDQFFGSAELFGQKLGGVGAYFKLDVKNGAWVRVGLLNGGMGVEMTNEARAGFLLMKEEIDFFRAIFSLKLDATYTANLPMDLLERATDSASKVVRMVDGPIAMVKKRLDYLIYQACNFIDAVLPEGSVEFVEADEADDDGTGGSSVQKKDKRKRKGSKPKAKRDNINLEGGEDESYDSGGESGRADSGFFARYTEVEYNEFNAVYHGFFSDAATMLGTVIPVFDRMEAAVADLGTEGAGPAAGGRDPDGVR